MRKLLVTSVLALGLVAALGTSATASPPTRESFTSEDTFDVTGLCSFRVSVTAVATGTVTSYFDRTGELVSIHVHVVEQDTFSAKGNSITGDEYTFNVDISFENGEVTAILVFGVGEKIRLPDGELFISAGVIDFLAQAVDFSIKVDHGVTGDIDALCAALSS
jgi:hypothetical protein